MNELFLLKFIKEHDDWEDLLVKEPYYLTITRDEDYIMFKYNQILSDFTLPETREARGIIFYEPTWECVCHAMDKFGNYGESYCPDINWDNVSVQEKIDGSLIKLWFFNEEWHISTNGTIDAAKANVAGKYANFKELFLDSLPMNYKEFLTLFSPGFTYFFELVSPYNRVVIPYDKNKIYYLGCRWLDKNIEVDVANSDIYKYIARPKTYPLNSLNDIINAASKLPWDREGYVVCDDHYNRVKIKSPAYVIAHYSRNNNVINTEHLIDIVLRNEQAEFRTYASDYAADLEKVESKMHEIARIAVESLIHLYQPEVEYMTKADYAFEVNKQPKYIKDFLFHCYNERIFWDYTRANNWTAAKWTKVIEDYDKGVKINEVFD